MHYFSKNEYTGTAAEIPGTVYLFTAFVERKTTIVVSPNLAVVGY
jgi:hypothetical protein